MKGVKYFPEQCATLRSAQGYIEQLPPDTEWSFWVSHDSFDAVLNIYVMPGEVNDFRLMLSLYSQYTNKGEDFVSFTVDRLIISIIEKE